MVTETKGWAAKIGQFIDWITFRTTVPASDGQNWVRVSKFKCVCETTSTTTTVPTTTTSTSTTSTTTTLPTTTTTSTSTSTTTSTTTTAPTTTTSTTTTVPTTTTSTSTTTSTTTTVPTTTSTTTTVPTTTTTSTTTTVPTTTTTTSTTTTVPTTTTTSTTTTVPTTTTTSTSTSTTTSTTTTTAATLFNLSIENNLTRDVNFSNTELDVNGISLESGLSGTITTGDTFSKNYSDLPNSIQLSTDFTSDLDVGVFRTYLTIDGGTAQEVQVDNTSIPFSYTYTNSTITASSLVQLKIVISAT